MTRYLELDDALLVIESYGFHLRDAGLMGSALARPSTTVMGQDAYGSLSLKAAALLESGTRNHPLVDGNKRTSWTLMVLFLWINGYQHDFTADQGFDLVVSVASGTLTLEQSAGLIASHMVARRGERLERVSTKP